MTAPTPAARRAARATLRPLFQALLDALGPLLDLSPAYDEAGRLFAATVTAYDGDRWEFTIQP